MRRLAMLLALVIGVLGFAISHDVLLAAPAGKQLVCHVTGNGGAHIIWISLNAVPAHLRNHGDCLINSTDRTLVGEPCDPTDANVNDICDIQP
ncbi:MAG TPA: hypothetical protein VFE28_04400 [Candidatus Krumholzibacteria bacterium]|nr:hypothetical protein [Candidatus Krumholzibacteria bacterium]